MKKEKIVKFVLIFLILHAAAAGDASTNVEGQTTTEPIITTSRSSVTTEIAKSTDSTSKPTHFTRTYGFKLALAITLCVFLFGSLICSIHMDMYFKIKNKTKNHRESREFDPKNLHRAIPRTIELQENTTMKITPQAPPCPHPNSNLLHHQNRHYINPPNTAPPHAQHYSERPTMPEVDLRNMGIYHHIDRAKNHHHIDVNFTHQSASLTIHANSSGAHGAQRTTISATSAAIPTYPVSEVDLITYQIETAEGQLNVTPEEIAAMVEVCVE